jgi:pimeloyl-ACP methyl ester carboxylesterase
VTKLVALTSGAVPNPEMDIVFVHGLDGHWRDTWTGSHKSNFWPNWLAQELPTCRLWSFDYAAAKSDWFGGSAMALVDRAVSLAHCLDNEGIGGRSVVFVAHSLGGLVTIQMLRHRRDTWLASAGPNPIIDNLAGIIFFATPHHGSFWASTATRFRSILRPSLSVNDLERADRHLADLNAWFRVFVADNKVPLLVYCETQPLWGLGLVVDRVSADPGIPGIVPVPLESDHIGLCKCQDTDVPFYSGVCKFVRDQLTDRRPIAEHLDANKQLSVHLGLDNIPLRYSKSAVTGATDRTLLYKLTRSESHTHIYPSLPYLDNFRRGGLITGQHFKVMSIACSFPALDFKLANNGTKTVFISEAEFLVKYSRPLRYPLLIFRDQADHGFTIRNEGAGPAINVQLRFTFSPAGEKPILSPDYRHFAEVGTIEDEEHVDLEEAFEADSDYPSDLVKRIEEAANRTKLVTAVGEVSWTESIDGPRKACPFTTDIYIGARRYGLPGPPSYIYDLQLKSDATSYIDTVPVSQVIMPGSTDRFQIALYCDTPSEHSFTVTLKSTEGVVLSTEIALEVFMPRTTFALIRSRESLGRLSADGAGGDLPCVL